MKKSRRYKYPPIEEALCEFRFVPDADWDLTIPGKLQIELGEEFSGKPREQRALKFGLQMQESKLSKLHYDDGLLKVQLVTKDGKRIIGVGPDVISVHMLRPYQSPDNFENSGWGEFRSRLSTALNAYRKVADAKSVVRVGVRYINKITIPDKNVKIEEYLKCANPKLEGLPELYRSFLGRIDYVYEDKVQLNLSYGLLDSSSASLEYLLDLDAFWQNGASIDCEESIKIADDLHERISVAFEKMITDKTRRLFDVNNK